MARIIFTKPSTEAFWMRYLHFEQFTGWLLGWSKFSLPAIMPVLLRVAVSPDFSLGKCFPIVPCAPKNHISSQWKAWELICFAYVPSYLIVRYMQLNLNMGFKCLNLWTQSQLHSALFSNVNRSWCVTHSGIRLDRSYGKPLVSIGHSNSHLPLACRFFSLLL